MGTLRTKASDAQFSASLIWTYLLPKGSLHSSWKARLRFAYRAPAKGQPMSQTKNIWAGIVRGPGSGKPLSLVGPAANSTLYLTSVQFSLTNVYFKATNSRFCFCFCFCFHLLPWVSKPLSHESFRVVRQIVSPRSVREMDVFTGPRIRNHLGASSSNLSSLFASSDDDDRASKLALKKISAFEIIIPRYCPLRR